MQDSEPLVDLRIYYDPMTAHIVRTRLEDHGIPCIVDDSMMSVYPIYTNSLGGIKLRVLESDLQEAEALLAEDAELPVEQVTNTDVVVFCPDCGSNNVRNKLAIPSDANWFTRIMDSLFKGLPLGDEPEWHCFNCGKDFNV